MEESLAEISNTNGGTANPGEMTDHSKGYRQLKLTLAAIRGTGSKAGQLATKGSIGYYWRITDRMNLGGFTFAGDFEVAIYSCVCSSF